MVYIAASIARQAIYDLHIVRTCTSIHHILSNGCSLIRSPSNIDIIAQAVICQHMHGSMYLAW